MVFYDLTSTYFEGKGPPEIGANGHSRDGKPRNPQVLVGLVMVDGRPIAHHVFAGDRRDAMTVSDVVIDLEQRFGLKRIVFVGDRGMVTGQNLDDLRGGGHGYIVGRNRRRSGEVFDYIQSATGPFIECPVGITAREKSPPPKTLVQEVTSNEPGVRVFVVLSEERLAFERTRRVKSMNRVRETGKAGAACRQRQAQSCREDRRGRCQNPRSQSWTPLLRLSYADGVFRFFEHPVNFTREQAYEGKYVIQTEEPNLSAVDAVRLTRSSRRSSALSPISKTSSTCDRSIIAPTIACRSCLRRRTGLPAPPRDREELKTARLDLSATEALTALKSVRVVDIDLPTAPPSVGHPWHSARRRSAARPRHHRPRSADPATTRPDHRVVTNRDRQPRKINRLHVN